MANIMSLQNYSSLNNNCQNSRYPFSGASNSNAPGNGCRGEQSSPYFKLNEVARVASNFLTNVAGGLDLQSKARENRDKAFAEFLRGISFGYLAMFYDSSSVVAQGQDGLDPGKLLGYKEVMDSAYAALQRAIDLSTAAASGDNGFPIPNDWIPTPTALSAPDFVKLIRSYRALFRAGIARTPTERAAADWSLIIADAQNGLTEDHFNVTSTTGVQLRVLALPAGRFTVVVYTDISRVDDSVRVLTLGQALEGDGYYSVELCGGTHVRRTGDIGLITVLGDSGVSAGVRRIEALTGLGAVARIQEQRATLDALLRSLNTTTGQAADAVQRLQADAKRLGREVDQLKMKLALSGGGRPAEAAAPLEVQGIKVAAQRADGLEKGALRGLSDSLRDRLGSGVVVLASASDGKVTVVVSVSKDLTGRVQAGKIVRELAPIVGGGGGGRPDFAEAGGKDASKIDELLAAVPAVLQKLIA